jgi:hypothetical protein
LPTNPSDLTANTDREQSKVDIMDHSISKKRKRRDAEAAAPAPSAEKISKKSKKSTKPVPTQEESSDDEEDDFGGFDEEEEGTTEQPNGDEAAESDGNDENEEDEEDNDEEAEENGVELPTDNAPILPLSSDAQSFDQLKLSGKTMNAINEMGFTNMTSIQKTVSSPKTRRQNLHGAQR